MFIGCGPNQNTKSPTTDNPAPQESPDPRDVPKPPPAPNIWASPSSWGPSIKSINFSGQTLFEDDTRIDDAIKQKFPELHGKYVLWRVTHDGSCWLSSGISVLIFHMIEGGEAHYTDVLNKMRAFAEAHVTKEALAGKLNSLDEFFDIFELIKSTMTHRFSIDLRNHQTIYDTLDKGMRAILAAFARTENFKFAQEIEKPKGWGATYMFKDFFESIGINPASIDMYFHRAGKKLRHLGNVHYRPDHPPTMLVLQTTPSGAFIDILVEKKFSDAVNAGLN